MNLFPIRAVLVLSVAAQFAPAATVTSPTVGNSSGCCPFLYRDAIRYQQVYSSSDFVNAIPGGGLITQMAFAPTDPLAYAGAELTNVIIAFSITQATPGSLSPVFSDNVGVNQTVVFSGDLRLFNDAQTMQFSQTVGVSPFSYDPGRGNLLMDVRSTGGRVFNNPRDPFFLASDVANNTTSSVEAFGPDALNAASGQVLGNIGLVTQFTITPVPEPSTVLIGGVIGATVVGIAVARRRNERRKADALK